MLFSIGYDPIEYDPKFWNKLGDRTIIHLDDHQADIDHDYQPERELIGDIALTVNSIAEKLPNTCIKYEIRSGIRTITREIIRTSRSSEPCFGGCYASTSSDSYTSFFN